MNKQKIKGLDDLLQLLKGHGDANIKIAVLDGPVDFKHPCFNTKNGDLQPFNQSNGISPSAGGLAESHGTAVASLIFGMPNSSVHGVAPGCSGIFIPIYSEDKNGKFNSSSQLDLAKAINLAVEKGANIINISGGQFSKTGDPDLFLKKAIDNSYKAGVLIVAATGNEGCSCIHVPASDKQVLAVGSSDENGEPTPETNFGKAYKTNGILAPGKNLTAAVPGGGTQQTGGGTSYATPVVSGVVGLLMSLQIQKGYKPDAFAIKSLLENTSTPCNENGKTDCRRFLRGQLNLPEIVAAIRGNPDVLISSSIYSQTKKISVMKEIPKNSTEEGIVQSSTSQEVVPSDLNHETAQEMVNPSCACEDAADSKIEKQPEEATVDPSCACEDKAKEEEKTEVAPSSAESINSINISGGSTPNTNNNNNFKKQEKMEKMETNQGLPSNNQFSTPQFNSGVESQLISPSGGVDPSDCGCGGGKSEPPATVYALGSIGYDFGSESHRDSFVQSMGGANPHDPAVMLQYLDNNPWDAEELIWTLNIDLTPIYALYPMGSHADATYERIREMLKDQINGNIQRVSVPGISKGKTSLLNGYQVSNLFPKIRGMYSWTTEALVGALVKGAKGSSKVMSENVINFLNRVYHQMRNLGVSAEERALNYAATNAFQASGIFATALKENLELDTITAEKSPICRPGSDCYDVVLTFFNPKERLTQARKEFRFTIDVSDTVPVTVGEVRSWSTY